MKYNNFVKLEECIQNSIELIQLRESFIGRNFTEDEIDKISNTIRIIKGIKNQNFYSRLKSILRGYANVLRHREEIKKFYNTKCDIKSEQHHTMLLDLWEELKGSRDISIPDKRWMQIGFQGNDPSTDFRGAGLLGLYNLHHFVKYTPESSKYVYEVSTAPTTWYFFCASGINFTGKIIELIEQGHLDDMLSNYKGNILSLTHEIYEVLFTHFNAQWVRMGITNFMKFNIIFEEFIKREAVALISSRLVINNKIY